MKRILAILLLVTVVVLVGVSAPPWSMAQAPSGGMAGHTAMISGKIASVDVDKNLLTLKTGLYKRQQFTLEPGATISDGQRALELEELTPGTEVSVEFREENGKRIAQAVTVEPAAREAGAEPAGGTPSAEPEGAAPAPAGEEPAATQAPGAPQQY